MLQKDNKVAEVKKITGSQKANQRKVATEKCVLWTRKS